MFLSISNTFMESKSIDLKVSCISVPRLLYKTAAEDAMAISKN